MRRVIASGRRSAAALLLLALLCAALAQAVELDSRVFDIARQLRCPVCTSESVADSSAELAQQMREIIQQQLDEGRSEAEILAFFQARYGDWILLDPPKRGLHLVVWVLPIAAGVAGVAALVVLGRRWVSRSREPVEVDPEDIARVRSELEGRGR
ncbi:MAG TPA: cytochrome c-type biogenesis protein CcmH [Trueperaceae bacterium]